MGKESETGKIERPRFSTFFPEEFIQLAPVEQGPFELYVWLTDNVGRAIRESMAKRKDYHPPKEQIGLFISDVVDTLLEDLARAYGTVLSLYAENVYETTTVNDPEKHLKHKKERENVPPERRAEYDRILSKEFYESQSIPLIQMIRLLNLTEEQKIIDDLFQQASSLHGSTSNGFLIKPT